MEPKIIKKERYSLHQDYIGSPWSKQFVGFDITYNCGNCNETIEKNFYKEYRWKYCPYCGEKIEWRKDDK